MAHGPSGDVGGGPLRRTVGVGAHATGRGEIGRGEPVQDGWLRFKVNDQVYRELTTVMNLGAIVTVDREAGRILGVRFLNRTA